MKTHKLKTLPNYFEAVWSGRKTFEIRYDDRGYQTGDTVILREFNKNADCDCGPGRNHPDDCARYTGREISAVIGWITGSTPGQGNQRGFNGNGYLVLALNHITLRDPVPAPASVTTTVAIAEQAAATRDRIEQIAAAAQRKGQI